MTTVKKLETVELNSTEPFSQNAGREPAHVTVYRFDIFKGSKDSEGKITKIKSVGSAYIREGLKTYTVHLKTFLKDTFYLLPNTRPVSTVSDFVILTREAAQNSGKKYFWNNVGLGNILEGSNHGVMELLWDVLPEGIYMTLHPTNVSELPDAQRLAADAA
jgi:hypothetical protein